MYKHVYSVNFIIITKSQLSQQRADLEILERGGITVLKRGTSVLQMMFVSVFFS